MSIIIQEFKKHPIHNSLNDLSQVIKKIEKNKEVPEQQLEHITRLKLVQERLVRNLEAVDPFFVSKSTLDNINSNIVNSRNQLNAYMGNLNESYINNIRSYTNGILHIMSLLKNVKASDDIDNITTDISNFREFTSDLMNNMYKDYNEYVDKLKNEYNNSEQKINEQESKLEQISKLIKEERDRINSVITQAQNQINEFNAQFGKAQENRIESFSNLRDKFREDFKGLEHNMKEGFENLSNNIEENNHNEFSKLINEFQDTKEEFEEETSIRVEEYFKEFNEHKNNIEKILNSLGIKSMAGGYNEFANKEKKSRVIWQVATVLSIIGLIGFSINFVNSFKNLSISTNEVSWALFSSRIIVVSAIGTLTAYCSRQATKHLENERYNRQMQLELAAINPYLSILERERKDKIMEELAYRFFGRYDVIFSNDNKEDHEEKSRNTILLELLQKAFNMNNKTD
ncbi:hypothetical protein [Senegalia massiliensis]|uniref:Uncharacterized protein n=1 Tax=Senegalia massiliensis TaxID=1720316 RepID=A0A845R3L1_9CLOT|nr:hypothetical protein [Senegalia massiliensis]NBI08266.1 hypothetical protein [Senegalia massiliensis]